MATSTQEPPTPDAADALVVLRHVAWSDYEAMLRIVGDRRIRVTYDSGTMEVGMPSQRHEMTAQWLGLFVTRLAEELEIPCEPLGMTTWKKPTAEKGLEADQCYYIEHQAVVREKEAIDLEVDPPPDLAIEVDVTRSSLNRMGIYAGLQVPEVWRHDGRSMTFHHLRPDGSYEPRATSRSFPGLTTDDVERFLELGRTTDNLRWARALREWVRDDLSRRV